MQRRRRQSGWGWIPAFAGMAEEGGPAPSTASAAPRRGLPRWSGRRTRRRSGTLRSLSIARSNGSCSPRRPTFPRWPWSSGSRAGTSPGCCEGGGGEAVVERNAFRLAERRGKVGADAKPLSRDATKGRRRPSDQSSPPLRRATDGRRLRPRTLRGFASFAAWRQPNYLRLAPCSDPQTNPSGTIATQEIA